jgi:cell division protein FtsA
MQGVLTSMNDKQIYAALEISDHEVRLIVGEFFNTRFNIIKVERIPCNGISGSSVTDPVAIINAIQKACADAEKMIGSKIERVILGMPSCNMKRYSLKSTVRIEGIDNTVTIQDVRNAVRRAEQVNIGKNYALIQTVCVKYTVNGISSRRIPLGERATDLTIDIDLLCADRKMSFDLVTCVEQSNLQVMDLYLDIFAVAKEAALFEQAVDQNVIVLKMEREMTTLGLITRGRVNSAMILDSGLGTIASSLTKKYGLNTSDACELVKYSAQLAKKDYSDNPVYIWQDGADAKKITEKELCMTLRPMAAGWVASIEKLCRPILQAGKTTVIITGEGGEMQGFSALLSDALKCEVKDYIPETLGGRNAGLSACLGLFYAYKDRQPITGYTDNSLDMEAFIKSVSYRERTDNGNTEDTLAKKLRGILFDAKK